MSAASVDGCGREERLYDVPVQDALASEAMVRVVFEVSVVSL